MILAHRANWGSWSNGNISVTSELGAACLDGVSWIFRLVIGTEQRQGRASGNHTLGLHCRIARALTLNDRCTQREQVRNQEFIVLVRKELIGRLSLRIRLDVRHCPNPNCVMIPFKFLELS